MDSHTLEVDGRAVRWHEAGAADAELTVFWHHGTPNTGEPPEPLLGPAAERGIRFLSLDRAGYGGSDPVRGRTVLDVSRDVSRVAAAAGVSRFAVLGHSGGGPHALGCATQLADAVVAVATIAGLAPPSGLKHRWFQGMNPAGLLELKAALKGGAALRALFADSDYDPEMFTPRDHEALDGRWAWFNEIAASGIDGGLDGMVLDDLAYVAPWGFRVADVRAPALVVHGTADRIVPVQHGQWLAQEIPGAEYWEREGDGHISVMDAAEDALDWLLEAARAAG